MSLKSFAVLLAQSGAIDLRLSRTDTGYSALISPATPTANEKPTAGEAALLAALAKPILITETTLEALEAAINENVPKMAAVRQSPIDAYAEFIAAQQASAAAAKKPAAAGGKGGGKKADKAPAAGSEDDQHDDDGEPEQAAPAAASAPAVEPPGESVSVLDVQQRAMNF